MKMPEQPVPAAIGHGIPRSAQMIAVTTSATVSTRRTARHTTLHHRSASSTAINFF
jgi:hypothetical protein